MQLPKIEVYSESAELLEIPLFDRNGQQVGTKKEPGQLAYIHTPDDGGCPSRVTLLCESPKTAHAPGWYTLAPQDLIVGAYGVGLAVVRYPELVAFDKAGDVPKIEIPTGLVVERNFQYRDKKTGEHLTGTERGYLAALHVSALPYPEKFRFPLGRDEKHQPPQKGTYTLAPTDIMAGPHRIGIAVKTYPALQRWSAAAVKAA